MTQLSQQKCVPCEGGVPPMGGQEIAEHLKELRGWTKEGNKIHKLFVFKNFKEAMVFVNKIAGIAESEGHHPDISIRYSKVDIVLWTHAIDGLSLNDFIVAAKIDSLQI